MYYYIACTCIIAGEDEPPSHFRPAVKCSLAVRSSLWTFVADQCQDLCVACLPAVLSLLPGHDWRYSHQLQTLIHHHMLFLIWNINNDWPFQSHKVWLWKFITDWCYVTFLQSYIITFEWSIVVIFTSSWLRFLGSRLQTLFCLVNAAPRSPSASSVHASLRCCSLALCCADRTRLWARGSDQWLPDQHMRRACAVLQRPSSHGESPCEFWWCRGVVHCPLLLKSLLKLADEDSWAQKEVSPCHQDSFLGVGRFLLLSLSHWQIVCICDACADEEVCCSDCLHAEIWGSDSCWPLPNAHAVVRHPK